MNKQRASKVAGEYFDDYTTITIWLTQEKVQIEWFEDDQRFLTKWYDFWNWEYGDVISKYEH